MNFLKTLTKGITIGGMLSYFILHLITAITLVLAGVIPEFAVVSIPFIPIIRKRQH